MKKKYLFPVICLFTAMSAMQTSCSHEDVDTFDTSYTALNIWVGNPAAVYESATYNYSYAYEEGTVTFYAQISGMPVDYDRTFTLEVFGEDSATVAPTVRTETYVLPAGAISGTYNVHFNSRQLASPDLFTQHDGKVQFRVKENDTFATGTTGRQSFTIILKNYLAKPDNWDTANYPRLPLSRYFGAYSRVKYQFMIEALGLVTFEINYNATTAFDSETNVASAAYALYLQQVMQRALLNYNETHDTPLTDETGVPVTF